MGLVIALYTTNKSKTQQTAIKPTSTPVAVSSKPTSGSTVDSPLAITTMKQKSYPGSALKVERTLPAGANFTRSVVSYQSDGLTMYGLLTVPTGQTPTGGWPVILLNHGYIQPTQYATTTSYTSMVTPFAASGFIVFMPDYRGNGNSQGTPTQVYVSPDYVTDSMNALASIKQYAAANPKKIGVFGHSMGGNITLHELVMTSDVKAAVIASGVVGSYSDILTWWNKREATGVLTTQNDLQTLQLVKQFVSTHGTPQTNASFYNAIDPTSNLSSVTAAVEIIVGTADEVVPPSFAQSLQSGLQKAGKTVSYHSYTGADHNLVPDQSEALNEAVTFFKTYLK